LKKSAAPENDQEHGRAGYGLPEKGDAFASLQAPSPLVRNGAAIAFRQWPLVVRFRAGVLNRKSEAWRGAAPASGKIVGADVM